MIMCGGALDIVGGQGRRWNLPQIEVKRREGRAGGGGNNSDVRISDRA